MDDDHDMRKKSLILCIVTDFVRSIIMSNPQMRTLIEENPEIGHVINDPAFLRQSIEMMR